MTSIQPYNITIGEQSPLYTYLPQRDGLATSGWNDSYTGSTAYVLGGVGDGTPYRTTEVPVSTYTNGFSASLISLTFQGAPTQQADANADPVCSQWGGTTIAFAVDLPDSSNIAVLEFDPQVKISNFGGFRFFGSVVSVSIGPAGTKANAPLIIDDRGFGWDYSPANEWTVETDPGAINGSYSETCSYSAQDTAIATYTTSNASALYVVGMIRPDIAYYSVQMNDGEPTIYNAYNSWTTEQQVLFMASGLDPTQQYTIQLQNYAAGYTTPPIGINCLRVDAVYVIEGVLPGNSSTMTSNPSIPSDTSLSSGASSSGSHSSTPVGVIVGGVIGGLAVLAAFILALLFFLWLRRTHRSQVVDLLAGKPDEPSAPALGPETLPIPYFNDNAELSAQPSNTSLPRMSFNGDASVAQTSLSDATAPQANWIGREKSLSAAYSFHSSGILATPFIPPSSSLFSSTTLSPSVEATSVIGDPVHPSVSPGEIDNTTPPQPPLSSQGHSTELPTYDSIHRESGPPQ
ncbi:hypothetical protein CALVIDRAFT_599217 [Calocera viscosa TUFC12733]|uniref:Uncharacterized protein n=1 Tax=Calocera viscosa (strain TUFC12733) TaxID=1330018 RepID=A0A167L8A5_CALVF|nr:hypothetical protein CALVIDRAFT_599217 [Calocera viscosa TUFC12733]